MHRKFHVSTSETLLPGASLLPFTSALKFSCVRRFFAFVAWAGLLTLFVQTTQADLLWDGDASQGTRVFKLLNLVGDASLDVVNDPTYGDIFQFSKPAGSPRCEAHGARGFDPQIGQTYYIGWRTNLTRTVTGRTYALFQWKAYGLPMYQNYPIVLGSGGNGNLTLTQYNPTPDWSGRITNRLLTIPIEPNTWYTHVLAISVSDELDGGYIEYWLNGVQQTFPTGSTRFYCRTFDGSYVDPKWGAYGAVNDDVTDFVHGLRIGTSYDDVAP